MIAISKNQYNMLLAFLFAVPFRSETSIRRLNGHGNARARGVSIEAVTHSSRLASPKNTPVPCAAILLPMSPTLMRVLLHLPPILTPPPPLPSPSPVIIHLLSVLLHQL
jgi:hypothetical protein